MVTETITSDPSLSTTILKATNQMFFRRKKLKNGFVTLETRPRETKANSCGMPCLFIIFQNMKATFLKHMPNKRRKKLVIFCSLPSLWDRFVLDICQEQVHIFFNGRY